MITIPKKSPLALLVAAVIALSACSSSNNSDNEALDDTQTPVGGNGDNVPTGSLGGNTDPATGGGDVDLPVDIAALPLDQLRDQLITELAAYPVESLSDEVVLLGETIAAGAASGTRMADGSFSINVRDEDVITATEKTQYDCPLGGTMVAEIGRMIISESSYSNHADHDSYQFDQCRIDINGEQLLDGSVRTLVNNVSASRGGFDNRDAQWKNFSWQQANGNHYAGSVLVDINRLLSFDNQESRLVTVDFYEHSAGTQLKSRVNNTTMTLVRSTEGSGFVQNFQFDADGQVTTDAGIAVQITTDATLSASLTPVESPDGAEAFKGSLSMVADDGGRLVMTAQPILAQGPKLVDIVFTSNDGEIKELEGQAFPELSILAQ